MGPKLETAPIARAGNDTQQAPQAQDQNAIKAQTEQLQVSTFSSTLNFHPKNQIEAKAETIENVRIFGQDLLDQLSAQNAMMSGILKSLSLGTASANDLSVMRAVLELYESQKKKTERERAYFSPTERIILQRVLNTNQFTEADKQLLDKMQQCVPGLSPDTAAKLITEINKIVEGTQATVMLSDRSEQITNNIQEAIKEVLEKDGVSFNDENVKQLTLNLVNALDLTNVSVQQALSSILLIVNASQHITADNFDQISRYLFDALSANTQLNYPRQVLAQLITDNYKEATATGKIDLQLIANNLVISQVAEKDRENIVAILQALHKAENGNLNLAELPELASETRTLKCNSIEGLKDLVERSVYLQMALEQIGQRHELNYISTHILDDIRADNSELLEQDSKIIDRTVQATLANIDSVKNEVLNQQKQEFKSSLDSLALEIASQPNQSQIDYEEVVSNHLNKFLENHAILELEIATNKEDFVKELTLDFKKDVLDQRALDTQRSQEVTNELKDELLEEIKTNAKVIAVTNYFEPDRSEKRKEEFEKHIYNLMVEAFLLKKEKEERENFINVINRNEAYKQALLNELKNEVAKQQKEIGSTLRLEFADAITNTLTQNNQDKDALDQLRQSFAEKYNIKSDVALNRFNNTFSIELLKQTIPNELSVNSSLSNLDAKAIKALAESTNAVTDTQAKPIEETTFYGLITDLERQNIITNETKTRILMVLEQSTFSRGIDTLLSSNKIDQKLIADLATGRYGNLQDLDRQTKQNIKDTLNKRLPDTILTDELRSAINHAMVGNTAFARFALESAIAEGQKFKLTASQTISQLPPDARQVLFATVQEEFEKRSEKKFTMVLDKVAETDQLSISEAARIKNEIDQNTEIANKATDFVKQLEELTQTYRANQDLTEHVNSFISSIDALSDEEAKLLFTELERLIGNDKLLVMLNAIPVESRVQFIHRMLPKIEHSSKKHLEKELFLIALGLRENYTDLNTVNNILKEASEDRREELRQAALEVAGRDYDKLVMSEATRLAISSPLTEEDLVQKISSTDRTPEGLLKSLLLMRQANIPVSVEFTFKILFDEYQDEIVVSNVNALIGAARSTLVVCDDVEVSLNSALNQNKTVSKGNIFQMQRLQSEIENVGMLRYWIGDYNELLRTFDNNKKLSEELIQQGTIIRQAKERVQDLNIIHRNAIEDSIKAVIANDNEKLSESMKTAQDCYVQTIEIANSPAMSSLPDTSRWQREMNSIRESYQAVDAKLGTIIHVQKNLIVYGGLTLVSVAVPGGFLVVGLTNFAASATLRTTAELLEKGEISPQEFKDILFKAGIDGVTAGVLSGAGKALGMGKEVVAGRQFQLYVGGPNGEMIKGALVNTIPKNLPANFLEAVAVPIYQTVTRGYAVPGLADTILSNTENAKNVTDNLMEPPANNEDVNNNVDNKSNAQSHYSSQPLHENVIDDELDKENIEITNKVQKDLSDEMLEVGYENIQHIKQSDNQTSDSKDSTEHNNNQNNETIEQQAKPDDGNVITSSSSSESSQTESNKPEVPPVNPKDGDEPPSNEDSQYTQSSNTSPQTPPDNDPDDDDDYGFTSSGSEKSGRTRESAKSESVDDDIQNPKIVVIMPQQKEQNALASSDSSSDSEIVAPRLGLKIAEDGFNTYTLAEAREIEKRKEAELSNAELVAASNSSIRNSSLINSNINATTSEKVTNSYNDALSQAMIFANLDSNQNINQQSNIASNQQTNVNVNATANINGNLNNNSNIIVNANRDKHKDKQRNAIRIKNTNQNGIQDANSIKVIVANPNTNVNSIKNANAQGVSNKISNSQSNIIPQGLKVATAIEQAQGNSYTAAIKNSNLESVQHSNQNADKQYVTHKMQDVKELSVAGSNKENLQQQVAQDTSRKNEQMGTSNTYISANYIQNVQSVQTQSAQNGWVSSTSSNISKNDIATDRPMPAQIAEKGWATSRVKNLRKDEEYVATSLAKVANTKKDTSEINSQKMANTAESKTENRQSLLIKEVQIDKVKIAQKVNPERAVEIVTQVLKEIELDLLIEEQEALMLTTEQDGDESSSSSSKKKKAKKKSIDQKKAQLAKLRMLFMNYMQEIMSAKDRREYILSLIEELGLEIDPELLNLIDIDAILSAEEMALEQESETIQETLALSVKSDEINSLE